MEEIVQETTAVPVEEVIQEHVEKASGFFTGVIDYFRGILPLLIIAIIPVAFGYNGLNLF